MIHAQDCEGCGEQIGTESYLLATDGISGKMVTFHKRCDPNDQDLKRVHKITLGPVHLGMTLKGIG